MARKDKALFEYVQATPRWEDRAVHKIAKALGLDEATVRIQATESMRLVLRATGAVGWHIVDVLAAD